MDTTNEWIPITDSSKPIDGCLIWVTVFYNGRRYVQQAVFRDNKFVDDQHCEAYTAVLAWMPYIIPNPFSGQIP